jgi:type II secretory pathway pseudopilin PulG
LRARQQGVTLAIVLVVFVIVMVAFLATYALSRMTGAGDERNVTAARLAAAAAALEQYAASAKRLPCPAQHNATAAAETGLEVRTMPAGTGCEHGIGVVPWKTIGLSREQAYDGWGRRISYRVWTGTGGLNVGSLTQPGGVSMVDCDTVDPAPTGVNAAGLCTYDTVTQTVESRRTTDVQFLAGKGLPLTDNGTAYLAAYVLISHGATGGGAWTSSGVQVELPSAGSRQRDHTTANGPFWIQKFSDVETSAKSASHFDDMLVYRSVADLVKRINLSARNWVPDLATLPGSILFDLPTVSAVSPALAGTNTGSAILDFGPAYVIGLQNSDATNISVDTVGANAGIGVVGGSNPKMSYDEREWMFIVFDEPSTRFGITVNDFGTYVSGTRSYVEQFYIIFYMGSDPVGSPVLARGCRADGGLATFDIDAGVSYNSVIVYPYQSDASSGPPGDSAFLLSEIRSCPATASNCRTSLWSGSNACP